LNFRLHYFRWWRSSGGSYNANPTYSSFKRTFLLEDGKVVYKIILQSRLQTITSRNSRLFVIG
jgi:hypothetical protein